MGKFKLNDNVVLLDEKSLRFALGYFPVKKYYNIFLVSGGKVIKEPHRGNLYTVEFNFPSGSHSFEIYEKRLCLNYLNPNNLKTNSEPQKSNHFFTNIFLLE